MLAAKLQPKYRYENCAVVALGDGGVMVGAQIASQLHCVLTMLMSSQIMLPHEPEAIASISSGGQVAYNRNYPEGQLNELKLEYHGLIEQEKLTQLRELNRLVSDGGTINKQLLRGHNVIVVSDGLKTGFEVDLVAEFLKPIRIEKLIIATPFASLQAVDRMHVLADEICCLNVVTDYLDTGHYYDTHDVPDHETVVKTVEQIVLNWR